MFSGRGTTAKAILDYAISTKEYEVSGLLTDNKHAKGIELLEKYKKPICIVPQKKSQTRLEYCDWIYDTILSKKNRLIVLAGFMKILEGKVLDLPIINTHPSIKYCGTANDVYKKTVANQDITSGFKIHKVTKDLDLGPTIFQKEFSISKFDSEESIQDQTQLLEKYWYPRIISRVMTGSIDLDVL